jgi:hypothetical protein
MNSQHFRQLEHMYATHRSLRPEVTGVTVSMGRAEMSARIDSDPLRLQAITSHAHYHDLLVDTATLAAGSLVEDRVVAAERFDMQVVQPGYSGLVTASAWVTLAQPPRYRVAVQLMSEEGHVLAQGAGMFAPSTTKLPPGSATGPSAAEHTASPRNRNKLEPAVYASVWVTPFGLLHLN